jgi:leucine dehydrogenase
MDTTQSPQPIVTDITETLKTHSEFSRHEKVFGVQDDASGLKARIFIHSVVEGRALGGCRRWAYESDEAWSADGLRLSRGMTRKSAVAGLPLGGAKAAINHSAPTKEMMRAFGKAIDMIETQYGITYITAEDVGITEELLIEARRETKNVRGIAPVESGVPLAGGDPGPFTAYGVYAGMVAAVKRKMKRDTMKDVRVAVQGLGDVGYYLCGFLAEAGAKLYVADLDKKRVARVVKEFGAVSVSPDDIVGMDVDVFAPCAMGGVLAQPIKAPIVAGSANNQQQDEMNNRESEILFKNGILYAPDYVVNSGGLISVFYEGEPTADIMNMIFDQVSLTMNRIMALSEQESIDTATISDALSRKMLA